jgi:hypothetical protein
LNSIRKVQNPSALSHKHNQDIAIKYSDRTKEESDNDKTYKEMGDIIIEQTFAF